MCLGPSNLLYVNTFDVEFGTPRINPLLFLGLLLFACDEVVAAAVVDVQLVGISADMEHVCRPCVC